jgi:hypothetical protein
VPVTEVLDEDKVEVDFDLCFFESLSLNDVELVDLSSVDSSSDSPKEDEEDNKLESFTGSTFFKTFGSNTEDDPLESSPEEVVMEAEDNDDKEDDNDNNLSLAVALREGFLLTGLVFTQRVCFLFGFSSCSLVFSNPKLDNCASFC